MKLDLSILRVNLFANSQSQTLSGSVFTILSKVFKFFLSTNSKFVSLANRKKSNFLKRFGYH